MCSSSSSRTGGLLPFWPFSRWGHYHIEADGGVSNFIGTDGIEGVWANNRLQTPFNGVGPDSLLQLLSDAAFKCNREVVLFKADSGDELVRAAPWKRTGKQTRFLTVALSTSLLLAPNRGPSVRLLPTAWLAELHDSMTTSLSMTPWPARRPQCVWRGSTTGP